MTEFDPRTLLRTGLVVGAEAAGGALLGGAGRERRPGLAPGCAAGAHPRRADRRRHRGRRHWCGRGPTGRPDGRRGQPPTRLPAARDLRGPLLTPTPTSPARSRCAGCPPASEVHYRVRAGRPDARARQRAVTGTFHTAPLPPRRALRLVRRHRGPGLGHQPGLRRLPIFRAMARARPGLLPVQRRHGLRRRPDAPSVTLPDGRIWRNIVTAGEDQGRRDAGRVPRAVPLQPAGREPARASPPEVPQIVQWDDHEVRNNWYPGEILDRRPLHREARGRARRPGPAGVPRVAADRPPAARRAACTAVCATGRCSTCSCSTCAPTRTPTTPTRRRPTAGMLGAEQRGGSSAELARSGDLEGDRHRHAARAGRAGRWGDMRGGRPGRAGAPLGRELEFASVLRFTHRPASRGIVLAHRGRALHRGTPLRPGPRGDRRTSTPFWEFVSGPPHAGASAPTRSTPRSAPQAASCTRRRAPTLAAGGYQHFGEVDIDACSPRP